MNVNEELQKIFLQDITSDVVIKREVLREVIWRAANFLSVGVKIIPEQVINVLDVKYHLPSDITVEHGIPEGAAGKRSEVIDWTTFTVSLEKAEGSIAITDEAKARQLDQEQMNMQRRKLAEAFAMAKDENILKALLDGAYSANTVAVASGSEWDSGSATADPEKDIIDAWGNILKNARISVEELKNCFLVVPAKVWPELQKLYLIGNIQQRLSDYLKTAIGLTVFPTKLSEYADTALLGISGELTAKHLVAGPGTPGLVMSEEKREGTTTLYTIRQYYQTKVVPESKTDPTNARLAKITNVVA